MNLIIYGLASLAAAIFAIQVPLSDRSDMLRRRFAPLAGLLAACYLGFTLYLVPGFGAFKYLHGAAGALVPWALLRFLDRLLHPPDSPPDPHIRTVGVLGLATAGAYVAVDAWFFYHLPRASVAEVALGLFLLGAFLVPLERLWRRYQSAVPRLERARAGYLLTLVAFAVGLTLIEAIVRSVGQKPDPDLGIVARAVVLQGPVPPLGAVFAIIFLFFSFQLVTVRRLLDLNEIFSRLATVGILGALLALFNAASVQSIVVAYPVHSVAQVFMVSGLFLLAYDPLSKQLERWIGSLIHARSQDLQKALDDIDRALPRVISPDGLAEELLGKLVASGRVSAASLYVWAEDRRQYQLVAERGSTPVTHLTQIASTSFTEGFSTGLPGYVRGDLQQMAIRDARRIPEVEARLQVLDALHADVVLPLRSAQSIIGWVTLKDHDWSSGFSERELSRIAQTVGRATVILENLQGFQRLQEVHRLAGLGTMAAGLAHEIRNPLAAIKGAAQFLKSSAEDTTETEMVGVIVDEVDRLNTVVTQFLDYARPLQLNREPADVNALLTQVGGMLRAQGLPEGVALEVDLTPDPPKVGVDAPKLKQVFLNLAHNGLQAMGANGTLTLRTRPGRLHGGRPAIEISVADTGCGILPDDLDKLFVPFFTTRQSGTGLGLAISKRLVQMHAGELDVSSEVGKGSVFTVRIPIEA